MSQFLWARLPAVLMLLFALLPAHGRQASPTPSATDEIVERERLRGEFAAVLEEFLRPSPDADALVERVNALSDRLLLAAHDLAPFIIEELDRDLGTTFDFCTTALGRIRVPEADAALRRAIARAAEEPGDVPRLRKAMAAWALGIQGKADVLDLLEEGRHRVAVFSIHRNMSLLEAIAFQTAPESIPRLFALIDRSVEDGERQRLTLLAFAALRRIADPVAVPRLVLYLGHSQPFVRREAARALATMGTPAAVDALLLVLDDPEIGVRRTAALSLKTIAPEDRVEAIAKRLEKEEDTEIRGALYRLLAEALDSKAWTFLRAHGGRDNPEDRRRWVSALSSIANPKLIEPLAAALVDPDPGTAMHAAEGLARVGDRDAMNALVAAIPRIQPLALLSVAKQLQTSGLASAGPALGARLVEILRVPVTDSTTRSLVERLAESLVALHHTQAAQPLREAAGRQTDRAIADQLMGAARRLEAIVALGTDVDKWSQAARDPERPMRQLALWRLAEIGTAAALDATFDAADPDDRVELLRAIAETRQSRATTLIRRLLTSPEFDGTAERRVGEMTAWAARRIGGPEMYVLLRDKVERRNGRDAKVTAYAALTGPDSALPLLRAYRRTQLQYIGWERGQGQELLDWVQRRLEAGRPLREIDVPPERLTMP